MRAVAKRGLIASVPLVSLLIAALDPAPRPALAVNEFASPPSTRPRASQVLKVPIQEPRAAEPPRTPDRAVPTPEPPRPRGVLVPGLIHRPANQVASILEHSGLRLGEQRREESVAPAGTVTRQTPEAGTRVRPGTTVDIAVAVPLPIPVPDLTGHSVEQARALLARARLRAGAQRARPSDARVGTVLTQWPIAGTRVRPGTDVDVTFAVAISIAIPAPVPPAPAAPVVPPLPAATAPRPPTPVVQQPKPDPVAPAPAAPAPSAPAVVPPPVAVAPPVLALPEAVTPPRSLSTPGAAEPRNARWPRRFAWSLGSALLLAAGGAVYYRRATLGTGQPPVTLPTLDFGSHWDTGTQQIGPAGPLRNGSGLCLVSGLEMGPSNIEDDHLVGAAHDTGGLRQ